MVETHHIISYRGIPPYPLSQPIWWILTITAEPAHMVDFHHNRKTGGYGGNPPYPLNQPIWWNLTITAKSADMVESHHIR
jgi:hypothetical protein